jgi:hypothetical protein
MRAKAAAHQRVMPEFARNIAKLLELGESQSRRSSGTVSLRRALAGVK